MATYNYTRDVGYGATGDDVKRIQEALNASGNYNLTVDGIWGDKTDAAVRAYQQANNLTVDGIVGKNTWGSLFGSSSVPVTGAKPTAPDSYSDIDLSKYDSGYQKSQDVINAETNKTNAENAVQNYGDFAYSNQATFDEIMNKILNREEFSYDLNGDALYQQYKDKYIQQGKMAMQDTMGQAAAMTGGYGNSYAATVGNQAYQASLENLNNIIPELYQMAYDKYAQEGQDLYNQYGMMSDDRNMEYGVWADKYNQLVSDRDYYGNEANNAYAKDYGEWSDKRDFDTNQYWNETNFGYGQYRDSVTDWENDRSFQEAQRQFNEQQALAEEQWEWQKGQYESSASGGGSSSGGSGSGSGGSGSGTGSGSDNTAGTTSKVPQSVINDLKGKKTNQAKEAYLWGLVEDKVISEDQMNELYAEYRNTTADLKDRTWTQVDDGGINWFWGVDNNAVVQDQYGNKYRLDDLVDKLVEEGMSKSDAKEFVKKFN